MCAWNNVRMQLNGQSKYQPNFCKLPFILLKSSIEDPGSSLASGDGIAPSGQFETGLEECACVLGKMFKYS
jgi:hypothetical protein